MFHIFNLALFFFLSYRVIENGIETVTVIENGQLKSRTVNGVPQMIQ